jgi:hypothetical protein
MTDANKLHPTDGARFLLEKAGEDQTGARYDAAIYTPSERYDYRATLTSDGGVDATATGEPAPADLEKKLITIARVIARDALTRARDGIQPWPHRVLRWRGPK